MGSGGRWVSDAQSAQADLETKSLVLTQAPCRRTLLLPYPPLSSLSALSPRRQALQLWPVISAALYIPPPYIPPTLTGVP